MAERQINVLDSLYKRSSRRIDSKNLRMFSKFSFIANRLIMGASFGAWAVETAHNARSKIDTPHSFQQNKSTQSLLYTQVPETNRRKISSFSPKISKNTKRSHLRSSISPLLKGNKRVNHSKTSQTNGFVPDTPTTLDRQDPAASHRSLQNRPRLKIMGAQEVLPCLLAPS